MKRFACIDVINGSTFIDYEIPQIKFGKSLVDKSGFVPIADAVHSLTAGNRAHVDDGNQYDFSDGVDNGADVSFRKKGRDLAEIYQDAVSGREKMLKKAQDASDRVRREESIRRAHEAAGSDSEPVSGGKSGESSAGE